MGTGTSAVVVREASCPGVSGVEPRNALLMRTCRLEIGPMGIEL